MIYTKTKALQSLKPTSAFIWKGTDYSGLTWLDSGSPPTEAEINAEQTRLQTEYDNNKYQRDRADAYPEIGDQLDDLYKQGAFSTDMAAKIKKVKDDNPKP